MTAVAGQPVPDRPAEYAKLLRGLYTRGPLVLRLLQHYRPYICPFEALAPLVPVGSRVLDVGCGGGLWLHLLAALGRIREGVGFDSAAAAIDMARAVRHPSGGPAARLTFTHLPVEAAWPEGPFDVVSIIDVMHHVPPAHQREAIRTAASRVAPGGVLLYKDMVRRPRWRAGMNRLHDLVMARQWIHYAPIADVEAWAADAGLTCVRRQTITRWWYGHELSVFVKSSAQGKVTE